MNTPRITLAEIERIVNHRKPATDSFILGIRGYYLDSMGVAGKNDRGIYDDAIIIVSRNNNKDSKFWEIQAFNANTDPSVYRSRIATLRPGNWTYKVGIHGLSKPSWRRYKALVQADSVQVSRDGKQGWDTGWFGINIHRGSNNSTSSEGCQTIHPTQWDSFIRSAEAAIRANKSQIITYVLVDETDRRKYIEGKP